MSTVDALFARIRGGDSVGVAALLASNPALARSCNASGISALMFALYHREREIADLIARDAEPIDLFAAVALDRLERGDVDGAAVLRVGR